MGKRPGDAQQYFSSFYGLQKRFINKDLLEFRRQELQRNANESAKLEQSGYQRTQTKAKCRRLRKKQSHRLNHEIGWIRDYMIEASA